MLTLYSYPELFGVADNNGYGLKVFAFLRLAGVPFTHEHIFDASKAPRGQLPYIVDDGETIGDSETIIAHVTAKYRLAIDAALTAAQRDTNLLVTPHARRSLLGDVVFALEGRALLAGVPRRADARASEPRRRGLAQGARIQFPALSLPGHRPLCARRRLRARPRRSGGAGRSHSRRTAMCTGRSRPASMPASMASSPISCFYDIDTPLKQFVAAHGESGAPLPRHP